MINRRSISKTTCFGFEQSFDAAAWGDVASDICASLVDARTALYLMMYARDRSAKDALNVKVQAASTKLDSVIAGITGAGTKMAVDFKVVWDEFKTTRDREIIPSIYRGNTDDARKIIDGIQYERLLKMWSIVSAARRMTRQPATNFRSKMN